MKIFGSFLQAKWSVYRWDRFPSHSNFSHFLQFLFGCKTRDRKNIQRHKTNHLKKTQFIILSTTNLSCQTHRTVGHFPQQSHHRHGHTPTPSQRCQDCKHFVNKLGFNNFTVDKPLKHTQHTNPLFCISCHYRFHSLVFSFFPISINFITTT